MIHDAAIDHPSAWTSSAIGGREGLTHRISAEQVAAADAAVDRVRGRPLAEITQSDFGEPPIVELMAAARHQVMHGLGAIILSGFDPGRYALDDYARLYWGLGTHLGTGMIQSGRGDLIGFVRREESGAGRGYTTDLELGSHTDFHEILSLASVSLPPSGGESGLVSALAIHNIIRAERPDLLPALYDGAVQEYAGCEPIVAERVPFFALRDGQVSCFYSRVFMRGGPRLPGFLSDESREALAFFDAVASRPEVRADFMLQPGEMLFWHNFQMLHSRQAFRDGTDRKRLLLRLWLSVAGGRPLAPEVSRLTHRIDMHHAALAMAP